MLTYVIRRLLYSVVVLIRGELHHLLVRLGLERPARVPEDAADRIRADDREHHGAEAPRRVDPGSVRLLGQGPVHEPVRHDDDRRPADPARPEARHGTHAPARGRRRAPRDPPRGRDRRVLGVTPVQRLRLHGDDVQLRRPRDAGLLARADAPGPVREHLLMVRRPDLLHREPERHRSGLGAPLRARPRAAPRPARASCS